MSDKLVSDLMHKGVIACRPDTPMTEVVRIVSDTDVHAIVVMDEHDQALGIVSHTDIIRLFGDDLTTYVARDVMSQTVFDIALDEPFEVEFWNEAPESAGEDQSVLEGPDMEILSGDEIPTGRIVFETLSGALDPYPRKQDAAFEWKDREGDEGQKDNPFSVLSRLKDQD